MKRPFNSFIWIGLGLSLLMALFLSPYGSSSPDGLEKIAETQGFKDRGEGWTVWKHAPFKDYTLPWIRGEKTSQAVSGFIGTLAIFLIAYGVGKWLRKPPARSTRADSKDSQKPDPEQKR